MSPRWRQSLAWVLVAAVLATVTAMYVQPDFMLTVAQQVWACF